MTTSPPPADVLQALCLAAARQIADECRRGVYAAGPSADGDGCGCGAPVVALLGRQAERILEDDDPEPLADDNDNDPVLGRLADLARLAHARFYAHRPDAVPRCWRQLYTDASLLQTARRWLGRGHGRADGDGSHTLLSTAEGIDALVHPLDRSLILAGGAGPAGGHRGPAWIHAALEALHGLWAEGQSSSSSSSSSSLSGDWSACPPFPGTTASAFVPPVRHPVPRTGPLGLAAFQAYLDSSSSSQDGPQPLVLTGLQDDWPARRWRRRTEHDDDDDAHPWAVPAYLRWCTLGGRRLVPVEAGRSYVDAGWTQALVPMDVVLRELEGRDDDDDTGLPRPLYLAQHGLLDQIPALRRDIRIPDACYSTPGDDDDDGNDEDHDDDHGPLLLNAWLGPAGTITPLHTDPHHNLLAQVVGRKYVRLYAPRHGSALRPVTDGGAVDMSNTSRVDVGVLEGWDDKDDNDNDDKDDDDTTTTITTLPYLDCILEPGDTLYIPRGWWHYVRSVSVSFSVSFWWD